MMSTITSRRKPLKIQRQSVRSVRKPASSSASRARIASSGFTNTSMSWVHRGRPKPLDAMPPMSA
jgi:hypothetical protein